MLISNLYLLLFSGKLDKGAVLKAICAGFEETTEPAICLSGGYLSGLILLLYIYNCWQLPMFSCADVLVTVQKMCTIKEHIAAVLVFW